MKHFLPLILLSVLLLSVPAKSQVGASLNGYLSNMQQTMFEDIKGNWVNDNLIHNRLNFKAYLGRNLDIALELRNRFIYGETVKYLPDYAGQIERDRGWADMSWNLAADSSFILNSTIDRLYIDLTLGKLQLTAGRQRINWGMNYVWNPNDIFNNYSFFDFDYVERPGSDAVRLQYFMGPSASFELAGKINHDEKYTIAGLFRFTLGGYDLQMLGGVYDKDEFVIGTGFSGYIGPVSLTGELTYLEPIDQDSNIEKTTICGFGVSYYTPFEMMIQFEYLYNQAAGSMELSNFTDFYYRDISLRDLSFAPHTFFGSLSYPVSPLIQTGVSAMTFPKLSGLFVGPSLDLSLRSNLDLSFIIQYFEGDFSENTRQSATLAFLRIKWNF
jgi:hypothetical protein